MEKPVDLNKKKVFPSRRSVLILNGEIIVAYNTNQPFCQQLSPNPDSLDLRRLHLPSFESNNTPYLCLTSPSPEYKGALLGILQQTDVLFPIVDIGGKFMLEPSLAESWCLLEQALESISLHLVSSASPFVALDYRLPPAPSEYGFTRTFMTRPAALSAAQKSRDAFQLLIAHATWGAFLHRTRAMRGLVDGMLDADDTFIASATYTQPSVTETKKAYNTKKGTQREACSAIEASDTYDNTWKSILSYKYDVHPAWVTALIDSSICDFSIRRSGIVIRKPRDWLYSNFIPHLIASNVPVWIIWGDAKAPISSVAWSRTMQELYGPSSYERTYAHIWAGCPESGNRHVLPTPPEFPLQNHHSNSGVPGSGIAGAKPKPAIKLGTGLQRLKTSTISDKRATVRKVSFAVESEIFEWIRNRKAEVDKARGNASTEQAQRYSQRQSIADKFTCPGRRGAIVYEWVSDEEDRLVRRLVNRADVPQVWNSYGDKQRWFNCVRNEWDLCHDIDPSDTPIDSDSEYDDWITCVDTAPSECSGVEKPTVKWDEKLSQRLLCDINACLMGSQSLGLSEGLPASINDDQTDTIEMDDVNTIQLLSGRFGFAYVRGSAYSTISKTQWSLAKALGVLGDSKDQQTFCVPIGSEAAVVQFIMHLSMIACSGSATSNAPTTLCDLYPENPHYLANALQPLVRIQVIDAAGIPLYLLIHSQDNDREWILAVTDPCTALLAIRSDPPTINEFVIRLMHSRTPFFTLKRTNSVLGTTTPPPKHKQRRFGLGERPPGHKLDRSDYVVYEAERVRVLENRRIARAAIKHGGILSRLVSDMVDECVVLGGPSSLSMEYPFTVTVDINGEQISFYDDSLSDEEISLLVGLYSIKSDEKKTPAEESWWPTAGKFNKSGLNIGIWTPKCEEWFRKRRAGILDETQGAWTATKWRNCLRFDMDTKKMYRGAKDLAARYIARQFCN